MPNTGPEPRASIHVAVAVLWRDNRVLIARRPRHVHQGGLLEFPGGKVEAGETVHQALVREVAEETGLRVPPGSLRPVIGIRHDYGDKRVFLDVWSSDEALGEPEGREGQSVSWWPLEDLQDEDFPAANRPIIRALRLPHSYAITGGFASPEEGLQRLAARLQRHRPALVLLRAPWLSPASYEQLAVQAELLCRKHQARLMLHGRPELLARVPAAGVHLPWHQAEMLSRRPVAGRHLLAVSCHNAGELDHALVLGADFVTLGPVCPTPSHPGAPTLGWPGFRLLTETAGLPVFALGGLGPDQIDAARRVGAQGVAGIGSWW